MKRTQLTTRKLQVLLAIPILDDGMDAKQRLLSTDAMVKCHGLILKGVVCKKHFGFWQKFVLRPALFRDSLVLASGDMNKIGAFLCSLWVCKKL